MELILLCEMCFSRRVETRLGSFERAELKWPMDLTIFKTHRPDLLPDPFPAGTEWDVARCRQCGSRPFLNALPQADGTVMLIDGARRARGSEGRVLTLERGYIPIPGYPGGARTIAPDKEDGPYGVVVETIGPDNPPSGAINDKQIGPVKCPDCGKQYQSAANLAKYHNCKKGTLKGA